MNSMIAIKNVCKVYKQDIEIALPYHSADSSLYFQGFAHISSVSDRPSPKIACSLMLFSSSVGILLSRIQLNDLLKGKRQSKNVRYTNFQSCSALKSIWIQKYLDDNNNGKWKLIYDFYLSKQGCKHLFSGNLSTKDVKNLGLGNEFLNEILYIWAEINFQETLCDFENSPLKAKTNGNLSVEK